MQSTESELMSNSRHFTVAGVTLAAAVAVLMSPGLFTLWDTMIGIILLAVLRTYGSQPKKGSGGGLPFSAVWSLCLVLALGFFIDRFLVGTAPKWVERQEVLEYSPRDGIYFVLWIAATSIRWRFRRGRK